MNTTAILVLFDLFFYICCFGKLKVSCEVTTPSQNILGDKLNYNNNIEETLGTAHENNKNENEKLDSENYITIKNLHDLKKEWFTNEKTKHEENKSKGTEKNLTINHNQDIEKMSLLLDGVKKETGCFRSHAKNVHLENVNTPQNDQDPFKNDNINRVDTAKEKSILERLNNDYNNLNVHYINKVEKNSSSNENFNDSKIESNYLQNMNNLKHFENEKGTAGNHISYKVKFTEGEDSDLNSIKDKIKYINKKIFNTTVNCFNSVKSKLKSSFQKNKNSLKKLKTKITKTDNNIQNPSAVNVLLIQAENYLIEINSRYAAKDSFELTSYISNLQRISVHIFNRLKENEDAILALLNKINERLELTAIEVAFHDVGMENDLCSDTDNAVLKYITFITNRSYFSIGLDRTRKVLYPKLTKIISQQVEQYIEDKVEALCNTKCVTLVCPPNSNCYNINGKEECRCFPGFAPVNSEGKFECVKKDAVDCGINNGGCDKNAECLVVDNNIKCECKEGFTGDGLYCSFSQLSSSISTIVIFSLCLFCFYFI